MLILAAIFPLYLGMPPSSLGRFSEWAEQGREHLRRIAVVPLAGSVRYAKEQYEGGRWKLQQRGLKWSFPSSYGYDGQCLKGDGAGGLSFGSCGEGGGGIPASIVMSETSFGQAAVVGVSELYARADHTHGTPTNPVPAHESMYDHTKIPSSGQKDALAGTAGTPGSSNRYVTDSDSRMSNSRTPTTHTHAESDITNLVTDLAGKASASHAHAQADITNLVTDLAGKAPTSHSHAQSDVTDLTSALAAKVVVGGQIGGTASSPTVIGITTSTPATLSIGEISDGQQLARSGSSIVGVSDYVYIRKSADTSNNTTTPVDVSGLGQSIAAGEEWVFSCRLIYDVSSASYAGQFGMNGPSSPTVIVYKVEVHTTATAATLASCAAFNCFSGNTSSLGTTKSMVRIEGILRNGSNVGTLIPRIKSSNASGTAYARIGGVCEYRRTN